MQRTCKQCSVQFEITDKDRGFYEQVSPVINGKKFSIPEPTLCPLCRAQQRMNWRTELHLFKRKSDFSGKQMLSMYPSGSDCKVYSSEEWWSDDWDPLKYGRDYDFSRPFFDQFAELVKEVPIVSLSVHDNENSEYINCASWNKNCYLVAGANHDENCYYGNFINYCKSCTDISFIDHCELCYECVDCKKCYNLKYSANCHNCSDSYFLYSCKNCRNCFGSVNLVGKEHVFMNEQMNKEDYEKRVAELQLDKRSRIQEAKTFFEQHRLKYPHKYMLGEMNEDFTGNAMNNCRRAYESFDVSDLEDCKYCSWFHQSKNCMDIYAWGFGVEECYQCMEVGDDAYHTLFCVSTYGGSDAYYSFNSRFCKNIFGCISLKNNQYCILNKQYSKEEYEALMPKIIEQMRKNGEWGEFFPPRVSPNYYNNTIAQDYLPIDKTTAEKLGAKWYDEPEIKPPDQPVKVPDSILDTDKSICDQILTCSKSGKSYKIIPQELEFYKNNNIPVPDKCFEQRHKDRLQRRNPRMLWDRKCDKCGKDIRTSYSPEKPEKVYCEKCYLETVY